MKSFSEFLKEDTINELVVGAPPKKKDKKGNAVYIDFVKNGVRIKWFIPKWSGNHVILVHPEDEDPENPDVYLQNLYHDDADYFEVMAKYEEMLNLASKGKKIDYVGSLSFKKGDKKGKLVKED